MTSLYRLIVSGLLLLAVSLRAAVPVLDATGRLDNGYMPLDLSTMTGTFGGLYVTAYSLGTVAGAGTATLVPGKSSYVLTTSGSTWTLSCPGTMPDGDIVIYGTSTYNGGTQTATLSNAAVRPEQDPTSTTNKFYIASAPSSRYVVYLRLLSGVIDEFSVVGDTFSPGGGAALWASDGSTLSPSPAVDRIDISPTGQIVLAGTSPNDSNWSEFGVATNGTLGFVAVGDVDAGASTNWMFFTGSYTNIMNQEGSWLFATGNASTRLAEFDVTSGGPSFNNSVTLQSGNDIGNIRILGNGGTPLSLDPFAADGTTAYTLGTASTNTADNSFIAQFVNGLSSPPSARMMPGGNLIVGDSAAADEYTYSGLKERSFLSATYLGPLDPSSINKYITVSLFSTNFEHYAEASLQANGPAAEGYVSSLKLLSGNSTNSYEGTFQLNPAGQNALLNSTINGSTVFQLDTNGVQTVNPSGGTAKPWRLGSIVTGASVILVTTNYVEIDINGVPVKLAIVQ